jgi:hypothetical protein
MDKRPFRHELLDPASMKRLRETVFDGPEHLKFARALTEREVALVQRYLARKYAIPMTRRERLRLAWLTRDWFR